MIIHGAIFDMDGTLLDSMYIWDHIGEAYLRQLGLEPEEDLAKVFKNMSLPEAARYYQKKYGVRLSTDEIVDGVNTALDDYYRHKAPAKPGARQLLELLRTRGVRMCLATATDRGLVEAALARTGLLPFFERTLTCGEVGHGKSEPFIYEMAQELLGTRKRETVVFEDALYAVQTAKDAHFPVVGVRDSHEPCESQVRALSDIFLESLLDIDRLEGWLPAPGKGKGGRHGKEG